MAPDREPPEFLGLGTPQDTPLDTGQDRGEARAALGLDRERFTIVFLGSWSEARTPADLFEGPVEAAETYRDLFRAFAGWDHRHEAQLLVKLHPSFRPSELFEETRRCLLGMAEATGCPAPRITVENLPEALAAADVLVGYGFTSVFSDGFLRGCPSIVVPIPHYVERLEHPGALLRGNVLLQNGIIRPAFTGEEVLSRVAELMEPAHLAEFREAVDAVKKKFKIRRLSVEEKSQRIREWIRRRLGGDV
jgi:hypothetical protein